MEKQHRLVIKSKWMFFVCVLALLMLAVSSCQKDEPAEVAESGEIVAELAAEEPTAIPPAPTPEPVEPEPVVEPTEIPPTEVPPEPTPLPDHSEYYTAWESGSHSLYDEGHGPNTWCSRCHSPQNWDPEAFQGPPPSCFSCKMPMDEEVRIAEGNPFVSEEEWVGIICATCHEVDENGIASEEIAWLNPILMEYEAVNTPTELCEKCHVTTTGNAFGSAVDHKITLGGSAHLNYGGFLGDTPPPQYCSDCHDPHSLVPKECEDCHDVTDLDDDSMGGAFHLGIVDCIACHNALEYTAAGDTVEYGPHPDATVSEMWTPQITTMGRGGPSTNALISHSVVYEVACDRCHFEANLYELDELTAAGEIPEVDICKDGETLTVLKPELDQHGVVDEDYTLGTCDE